MEGIVIQPVYIFGESKTEVRDVRGSEKHEIAAIKRIREALINRPETKAEILEVKMVDKAKIPENKEITEAWKRVHAFAHVGTQYEWISRYAYNKPMLEIGIEKGDPECSYANCALRKHGKLASTGDIHNYKVDPYKSNADVVTIFGNLRFPIIEISEVEMNGLIKAWGYEDIMKMIWFCHTPIRNKPCGLCRPCNEKIESNMQQLLPQAALHRNWMSKNIKGFSFYSRIMRATFWKLSNHPKDADL